jgi:hypothetical protein
VFDEFHIVLLPTPFERPVRASAVDDDNLIGQAAWYLAPNRRNEAQQTIKSLICASYDGD